MSSLQRNAHVTGLNNTFANQYPETGSMYRPVGGGAPGILAGLPAGFTVALGVHQPATLGNNIWNQFGPEEEPPSGSFPSDESIPGFELLVGTLSDDINDGWAFVRQGEVIVMQGGDTPVDCADFSNGERDLIVLASFIGDDTPYGGAGDMELVAGNNGWGRADDVVPTAFNVQTEFVLGGTVAAAAAGIAATGAAAGSLRTQINSFWITAGIPNFSQMSEFFSQSMQAGQIIPQAWAPVRVAGNLTPETPSSPTGHHWTASDLALVDGIGGTWTDRIGGIVLERVGAEGEARELGKGHGYWAGVSGG